MNTEQLDNARRDFMRLVDAVLKGTLPGVSAAILKLEQAAWQFAKLRQSYEPLIQRETMMRAPDPVIVAVWQASQDEKGGASQ